MQKKTGMLTATTAAAILASLAFGGAVNAAPEESGFGVLAKNTKNTTISAVAGNMNVKDIVLGPGDGVELPDGSTSFSVPEVASGLSYTRKSGTDAGEQPTIVFPNVTLTTDSSTPADWEVVLDKSVSPFNLVVPGAGALKSGLPGWATVEDRGDKLVIRNNTDTARLGGSNKKVELGVLEFYYEPATYQAGALTAEFTNVQGVSGTTDKAQGTLRVSTLDSQERVYGKWSALVDAKSLKDRVSAGSGKLVAVGATKNDFTIEDRGNDQYLVTYVGRDQNRYVRGADSQQTHEEKVTGYVDVAGVFQYERSSMAGSFNAKGMASDGTEVEVSAAVASDNARKLVLTYVKMPASGKTTWSVDLDLASILKNASGKPVSVSDSGAYSITQKEGTIYTLNYIGGRTPAAGTTLNIQASW